LPAPVSCEDGKLSPCHLSDRSSLFALSLTRPHRQDSTRDSFFSLNFSHSLIHTRGQPFLPLLPVSPRVPGHSSVLHTALSRTPTNASETKHRAAHTTTRLHQQTNNAHEKVNAHTHSLQRVKAHTRDRVGGHTELAD
jgi:hypothetical protein